MSRHFSHLNTAKHIIQHYRGEVPLAIYLKHFFSQEKKYGSKDRRSISELCYSYYRLGGALRNHSVEDKILSGLFLTRSQPNELLAAHNPALNSNVEMPLQEKMTFLGVAQSDSFPFKDELSEAVDFSVFATSFIKQPDLFIRTRPGRQLLVEKKLKAANIKFQQVSSTCFAFENGTKLDSILEVNKDYVVQDYNSQQTFSILPRDILNKELMNVWDCCAASGGKSIMTFDTFKNLQLTVSDVRASIINNLHMRLKQAGITNYFAFKVDLSQQGAAQPKIQNSPFDLIICDAPCSGSGTWSRTPEQLAFFKREEIERYSRLQKTIAGNVLGSLKPNGYLLYITCSVFTKENEEVVQYLTDNFPVIVLRAETFPGYERKADTMFAALLQSVG